MEDKRRRWHLLATTIVVGFAGLTSGQSTRPAERAIQQSADGKVLLQARDAVIHGKSVRYEPAPNQNALGNWTGKGDAVSWDFEISHPGKFEVVATQACGKGSGGSEFEFTIDSRTCKITVQEPGEFQKFIERPAGVFELSAEKHTLIIKLVTKPGSAVMDLRQVMLVPVREE